MICFILYVRTTLNLSRGTKRSLLWKGRDKKYVVSVLGFCGVGKIFVIHRMLTGEDPSLHLINLSKIDFCLLREKILLPNRVSDTLENDPF